MSDFYIFVYLQLNVPHGLQVLLPVNPQRYTSHNTNGFSVTITKVWLLLIRSKYRPKKRSCS